MADVVCFGDLLIDFVPTVTGKGLVGRAGLREGAGRGCRQRRRGPGPAGRLQRLHGQGRRGPVRPFPGRHAGGRGCGRRCAALRDRGPDRPGLRLPARRRRARVPLLPPSQRRHAVPARRGRRERDRGGPRPPLRFDQPGRRAAAPDGAARGEPGPGAGQADLLRRQPPAAAVGGCRHRQPGHPRGPGPGGRGQAQRRRARLPDRQPRARHARAARSGTIGSSSPC